MKKYSILSITSFSIFYTIMFSLLENRVISPLILPENYCHYHFVSNIPWWVDFFYISGASNGHPDGTINLFLLKVVLGIMAGIFTHHIFTKRKKTI